MTERAIDINQTINDRANERHQDDQKAVRGTAKGFWSRQQRDERTKQHVANWAKENKTTLFDSSMGGPSVMPPSSHELSRVHKRTRHRLNSTGITPEGTTNVEPSLGSSRVAFDATSMITTPIDGDFNVPTFQGVPNPEATDFIDIFTNVVSITADVKPLPAGNKQNNA